MIFFSYLWYDYTLTNMNCKTITERLKRVAAIVDSWRGENGVPQIERDIALGELRDIYNALLVVDAEEVDVQNDVAEAVSAEQEVEVEVIVETPLVEDAPAEDDEPMEETTSTAEPSDVADVASMEAFYNALDIDALLGLNDEPVSEQSEVNDNFVEEPQPEAEEKRVEEPVVEPVVEVAQTEKIQNPEPAVEPEVEPIVEPVVEPIVETKPEDTKSMGAGLFDLNDIPVRSKSRRKMISLYSDNPTPVQSVVEPVKMEQNVVEKPAAVEPTVEIITGEEAASVVETISPVTQQRLGESFGEVKTLADQMARNDAPTTPFNRITELRQAIGLNDKFLMIRDLFGGDAARYEATIDTLDEFEDLDECIIYIVENFRWNPDLEAAKLLVSLIERKLA